jgi:hypothetical protein
LANVLLPETKARRLAEVAEFGESTTASARPSPVKSPAASCVPEAARAPRPPLQPSDWRKALPVERKR